MIFDVTEPVALPDAVRAFDARSVVGTALRSAELEGLPLAFRQRAFFSAGVESARFLERAKREIDKSIKGFGINRDRASFVKEMQELADDLGIRPVDGTRGTLEDIGSMRRLELIYRMQTEMAFGEADWRSGQDEDILNAFPAQELLRIEDRVERRDWVTRWSEAGGEFFGDGRMVALKTDGIWAAISRFDVPWPPFDFGSGMGLRDVRRREAVELGLLQRGQRLSPIADDFDEAIEVGLQGLSEPVAVSLQSFFGPTAQTVPDGSKMRSMPDQAVPLRHVLRLPDALDEMQAAAAMEGLDMIDAVHGIDAQVGVLVVVDGFVDAFDLVEQVGGLLLPETRQLELAAVKKAVADAVALPGPVVNAKVLLARAYAQFVAMESGRVSRMKKIFWQVDEFRLINEALRALFKSLNWLR